jgi:bifunctional non-homologous end joining protein LigD
MVLDQYRAKRDFRRTPEPSAKNGRAHRRPIFVVQEHHARRLHYDFRLEADHVLKSWAVPKPPSMDPVDKRLAVHVEDHPIAYADFHGTIPPGQYGAGKVKIWDKGTFDNLLGHKPVPQTVSDGITSGRVEIDLHGKKLKGRFVLVRMNGRDRGKDNWLLIKMRDEFARVGSDEAKPAPPKAPTRVTNKPKTAARAAPGARVAFTSLDKVMYPDDGYTKADVLEYYLRIAAHLLPFLRGRPATLERLPDGIGAGPHFLQKNTPASYPDWIPRVRQTTGSGKAVDYALVNDAETLLYLVNQGTLTFHVWFSRVGSLDRPDYVLFDLDPGQATFADAVAVANELHGVLKREGVESYPKTSGKTGLHVLVPWELPGGYAEARAWGDGVARQVVAALPDRATTERSKAARGRRVYVDLGQNAKSHHVAPPYVLRPVPGAPVSTPLAWREVTPDLDPKAFNLKTIFRRLARRKTEPIAALVGG